MVIKRSFLMIAACLPLTAAIIGCGGVAETKVSVQSSAIADNVKKTLTEYAESGKVGSSMTSLESDINGIAASDAAKGEALKKGYLELQQVMNEPEKGKDQSQRNAGLAVMIMGIHI